MDDVILKMPNQKPSLTDHPVGLLAGAGKFPIHFARQAQELGIPVYGFGIEGMVWPELKDHCDHYFEMPISRIGLAIRLFKRHRIKNAVMAGKVEKIKLFQPWRFLKYVPDWRTLHLLYSYARENKKDDTLLLAVIKEFERDQIHFQSALEYCPELLVPHGFLTRRKPTESQWKDIRFGWQLAKEMGRLDVGQSVMVYDTAVMAIEAIEGTDRAIQRAGELCRRGGFTVVKVAKPDQDMRFDVPTVGAQTLHTMHEAGGRVLAIEAGMTIMLEQEGVLALADKLGIAIVSLNADELALETETQAAA